MLVAGITVLGMLFSIHEWDDFIAWRNQEFLLHQSFQLLILLLLFRFDRLIALRASRIFRSFLLEMAEFIHAEDCFADLMLSRFRGNREANHAFVVFPLDNWAGFVHHQKTLINCFVVKLIIT